MRGRAVVREGAIEHALTPVTVHRNPFKCDNSPAHYGKRNCEGRKGAVKSKRPEIEGEKGEEKNLRITITSSNNSRRGENIEKPCMSEQTSMERRRIWFLPDSQTDVRAKPSCAPTYTSTTHVTYLPLEKDGRVSKR
jgi:hypothetical protein